MNNFGSYVILSILVFHILVLIIFYINQNHFLIEKIINIRYIVQRKVNKEEILTTNEQANKMSSSHMKLKTLKTKSRRKKSL